MGKPLAESPPAPLDKEGEESPQRPLVRGEKTPRRPLVRGEENPPQPPLIRGEKIVSLWKNKLWTLAQYS